MQIFFESLKWANEHGLWNIIQTMVLLVSFIVGLKLIFFPKRRVRNLNFFTQIRRDHPHFPLRVHLEIRNYTGRSVVISSPYFKYSELKPDPNAHGDSPSGEYEIKFPDPSNQELREVEYLLRNKESVYTWIPLDPSQPNEEVERVLQKKHVGSLTCMCTWLEDKPRVHKLVRKI